MPQTKIGQAKEGIIWIIATNLCLTFARFGLVAILARLLTPAHFGLHTTFLLITAFFNLITIHFVNRNLVLSDRDDELFSSAILVSLAHSAIAAIILFIFADFIQSFFSEIENLNSYLKWGASLGVFVSMNNVFSSVLEKEMKFKWLAMRKLLTLILGTGILPILLILFFDIGVWALLAGLFIKEIIDTIILIRQIRWKFIRPSNAYLKAIYTDYASITGTSLVNQIALKGDYLIISKFLGATSLGLYSKAYQLMTMPTMLVAEALQKVGLSSLADSSKNHMVHKQVLSRVYFLVALIVFPLTVVMFYGSETLILLFLGPDWLEAYPAFQILCFGMFFRLAYKVPSTILQVRRRFTQLFFIEVVYATIIIGSSYFLVDFGISGVAYGVLAALFVQFITITEVLIKELEMNRFTLYKNLIFPTLFLTGGFLVIELVSAFSYQNHWINSILSLGYLLIVFILTFIISNDYFKENIIWWKRTIFQRIS